MRSLFSLALLLATCAASAMAEPYRVELVIFRQAGTPLPAAQTAPDDWRGGAPAAGGDGQPSSLEGAVARLTPAAGYQVLLHQAWTQELAATPSSVALSQGGEQFGHFPVEGTLSLSQGRFVDVSLAFWINRFAASGLLESSERLKQSARLKTGELNYLDHSNLGVLIKVVPQ